MSEMHWVQSSSDVSFCKTHMQFVSTSSMSLHPQQLCSVTKDIKGLERDLNLTGSNLEEGLERIREERKRISSIRCLVCGQSAAGLKIETMKTYCEMCYPDSIKNAMDISTMSEEDLRRTFDIVIRIYSQEVPFTLSKQQIEYIYSPAPVAEVLNYLQKVVLRAELDNPDRVLSCVSCKKEFPPKLIIRTIRMIDSSIHYCEGCFQISNIGIRYLNPVVNVSFVKEFNQTCSLFHSPCRVSFSREIEDSCGEMQEYNFWWEGQVLSSHSVRLSALLLGGLVAGWTVVAIMEIKLDSVSEEFFETVDSGARQARLLAERYLPAGQPLHIVVNLKVRGNDSIVFRSDATDYYLGNDGSMWLCKPEHFENCGLLAIEYYCRKTGT